MLTSITPLGERGRSRRWSLTTAWYLLGSTVGGAAIGAIAGGLAAGVSLLGRGSAVLLIGAVACLSAAASDARGVQPPSWRRQVDETWLPRYRGWVIGGGFGVQLGFAVATIVSSASVYAALLLAVLSGSFGGGLAIGTTFGLLRAAPLLSVRRVRSRAALAALHRRVSTIAPLARRATVGVLAAAAFALAAAALAGAGS